MIPLLYRLSYAAILCDMHLRACFGLFFNTNRAFFRRCMTL